MRAKGDITVDWRGELKRYIIECISQHCYTSHRRSACEIDTQRSMVDQRCIKLNFFDNSEARAVFDGEREQCEEQPAAATHTQTHAIVPHDTYLNSFTQNSSLSLFLNKHSSSFPLA